MNSKQAKRLRRMVKDRFEGTPLEMRHCYKACKHYLLWVSRRKGYEWAASMYTRRGMMPNVLNLEFVNLHTNKMQRTHAFEGVKEVGGHG